MPIPVDRLTQASFRSRPEVVKSFREAKAQGQRTAFLCHSHSDRLLASGLVVVLEEAGWDVYVDWADPAMPPSPTRETAQRIQERITLANFFLFLATANSLGSGGVLWEIGDAGTKPTNTILIVPTRSGGTIHGNEYLGLYRSIDIASDGRLAAWPAGSTSGGVYLSSM